MRKVLIIDDEITVRRFLEHYLQQHFQVITKDDGLDALNWLRDEKNVVDAIVADWNMPQMDGITFTKALRATPSIREIPLIMLSGNEKSSDKIHSLNAGADDYVVKPFNPEEILARINVLLRRTTNSW